ncbi:hypothetical protein [Paraburkholderia tropica]|uniref:hypothetical protein n=1 Tax=Paraburkholderia tropica TaxID=92647 RepID=UPI002AB32716|nr:hypothetical protein [Paraburkholderia tropica]
MRMQISRVTNSSLGSSLSSVPEFEMSGVLSEWLFAVGFWRNFNAAHGTMFDQFEEDEADETVVRAITFALADQMQLLEGRPEEVLDFAYRRNVDGSSNNGKHCESRPYCRARSVTSFPPAISRAAFNAYFLVVSLSWGAVMKANTEMREKIGALKFTKPLIPSLKSIADGGFVEKDDCYLLDSFAQNPTNAKRTNFQDCTGYECFVNSLHVEDYADDEPLAQGILFIEAVFRVWKVSNPALALTAIISADELAVVTRFHVKRSGQQWLSDDIEGHIDAVMSVDSDDEMVYRLK